MLPINNLKSFSFLTGKKFLGLHLLAAYQRQALHQTIFCSIIHSHMKKQTGRSKRPLERTEKMSLHPITLAFRGTQSHLEKPFLDDYFIRSLPIVRFACFVTFLLYGLFGILDAYLVPEQKKIFWLYRYAFFCPLTLGIIFFSFSSLFKKVMQPVLACSGILAGGGIIMMILLAPPPANYSYYAGLILIFMMAYTVIKIRFLWACGTCWFLILLYEFTAIGIVDTPILILINNNFFFIGANLIGMIASYSMEHYSRRDFYMKTLLNEKREHIRNARDMLEERVHERTSQLVEANKRIIREMNERIQAEEENTLIQAQLSRQQKMESLGLMAGGVAHDLNNILSGIISYPELLLMDLPKGSKLKEPIQEIQKSGIRAAAVVADLLTVARGVASQYEIVSANDLVEEYLSSPEYKEQESLYPNISLELSLEADLPNCKCSPVHIQKVLMNLINNGFEAIEISGKITLSTISQQFTSRQPEIPLLDPGEYVVLRVSDNGPGIPAKALQHIFEPFYSKKVMGRSGTGLGLAVVWNTVLEHNGTVNVESNDHGTTFTIYLPVTTEEKQGTTKENKIDLQGTATILMVDDERIQRDIGRRILTKLGYKIHTTDSGENAVAFLQTHAADLVILDMLMDPGMSGLQTYKEIKTLHPGQKAIIVSGFSESDDVKETLQLGASEFVKKPYSVEQIGRVVKQALLA